MSSSQSVDKQPSASDAGLKIWSCVICRRRKVRCDRRDPCSNCVKNNIECHFPVTGRIPRRNQNPGAYKSPAQKQSELLSRLRRLESVVTELAAQVEDGSQDPRAATVAGPSGAVSITSPETGQTLADSEDPFVTEPSLTVSSGSQQAGSEYDEEFGRLVVDKDGGLHVGNRFWSVFCGEVDNILQAVHDVAEYSGDSIMPEPGLEGGPSPLSHLGFVFGNADFAKALDGLNPMPSQMLFIWQAYVENVDPLIKVLHVPTVEKVVRELRGHFSAYGAGMEALLFAISLAAITSMNEQEVSFNFNTPKPQLIQRYQFGTEQALARADFLVTKDIIVLQALAIYLSLLPHLGSKEKVWPMMGLVLRLAKSAGLHREDDGHTRSQLEMETRRRLWWQICFVDSQSRRAEAPELSITPSSFDTSIPSNLDDIDLLDGAPSHLPASHETPTATTLCLIRCELWRLTQSLRDDAAKSPESRLELLNLTKAKIETKYLCHIRLGNSWDNLIKTMATLFFSKVELLIRRQPNSQHSLDTSLESAMNIIKSAHALKSNPSWSKWRWQLQGQVPWHAMGVFLRQACRKPWAPPLEEAWQATQGLVASTPESAKSGPMWKSLMSLSAGAQAHRERELGRQEAEAQPGSRAGEPTSFNAEAAATVHSHDSITINESNFQSSLHISHPDPDNLLMHQQGIRLHGASDNPLFWSPAGGITDLGQAQPHGDISIFDDASLMDWEALVDMDGSWATWDLF